MYSSKSLSIITGMSYKVRASIVSKVSQAWDDSTWISSFKVLHISLLDDFFQTLVLLVVGVNSFGLPPFFLPRLRFFGKNFMVRLPTDRDIQNKGFHLFSMCSLCDKQK